MADVFISYAKTERQLATDLAHYLESEGYTVWWDTELTSGETFRNNIENELNAAKAVVVLWTTTSVTRDWVIAEAEHGARRGNLIPLRSADLDPNSIPKPYSTRHTELIENRPAIIAALKRLNVVPRYAHTAGGSLHDQFWKAIEGSQSVADYEFYLKEFPEGPNAPFARLRIHQLQQATEGQRKTKPVSSDGTHVGNAAATLFAGLFFSAVILGAAWYYTNPVVSRLFSDLTTKDEKIATTNAKLDRLLNEVLLTRKADDADWEKAETEGLIKSWQAYLAKRPIGVYEAEARKRLEQRRNNRSLRVLSGHEASITRVETDVNGLSLTSYDSAGWQFVWDIEKMATVSRTRYTPNRPNADINKTLTLSASSTYTLGGFSIRTDNSPMALVDIGEGNVTRRLQAKEGQTLNILESLGKNYAVLSGTVFDLSTETIGQSGIHITTENPITCITYTTSARAFCSGRDLIVYVPRKPLMYLSGHRGYTRSISATKSGAVLVSSDDIGEIRFWDISDLVP